MNTKEFDMSGIDPLRVPEARRRAQAITEYLELPNATTADAVRIAASLGLSRGQFQRMVRRWRDHRNPQLLVDRPTGPSKRDYGLATRAVDIAKEVIIEQGAEAELATIAEEIERRCAAEMVPPVSRGTMWHYLRAARASGQAAIAGPPRIIVGRMWFHIPVEGQAINAMPTLLAAVMLPERIVLAHAISVDPDQPPSIDALVTRVTQLRKIGAEARRLHLDTVDRGAASYALQRAGLNGVRTHKLSLQREISRAFAGNLGPLKAVYQRGFARPATKKILRRQDAPLSADVAIAAIEAAIDAHNVTTTQSPPPFDISNG